MKILLISPSLPAQSQAGSFKSIANVMPTLGIGYIAAMLEKDGFEVEIIDCLVECTRPGELESRVRDSKPDLIAFTATILTIGTVIEYARQLRKIVPNAKMVLGGPQISSAPEETMALGAFDIGVIGEGEITSLELARALREKKIDLTHIPGLALHNDGQTLFNEPRKLIENVDTIPHPARHLFPPLKEYRPIMASYKRLPVGHMMSSRGCPYQCIFCDRKVFGNKFRAHSADYVVEEMERLIKDHGAREIRFFDDTFTMDEKRVFDICDKLDQKNIHVPWTCLTRVDRVSPDILRRMKTAGCWQVIYGLETGDEGILKKIKKGATLEQARNAVRWAQSVGLSVRATFVFGLPGDTVETIHKTMDFAKELKLDYATFFTLVLYPGNELFTIAKQEGEILHFDYSQYTSIIDLEATRLHYVPKGITEQELKNAISSAYRQYYLRPGYILGQLLSIRRPSDLRRGWEGLKVLLGL